MFSFIKKLFGKTVVSAEPTSEEPQIAEEANIRAIVVTDLGNVRKNNEDMGYFVRPNDLSVRKDRGFLGIVADGMGGHAAGEVASKMAVEIIRRTYYASTDDIVKGLSAAFTEANKRINEEAQRNAQRRGMGTTATAVVIRGEMLYYAHIGDSRLYFMNDSGIKQLSNDHTYIQDLLRKGEVTSEQAAVHPDRNVLTQAMGTNKSVKVEAAFIKEKFTVGSRLVLSSDGLYDYVNDEEIYRMAYKGELKKCAYDLVNTAKARGGHDNITVLIIESKSEGINGSSKVTTDLEELVNSRQTETKEMDI